MKKAKATPAKRISKPTKMIETLATGTSARAVVGIVAPSSPAPLVELAVGASRLIDEGFEVYVHPQVKRVDGMFAGSDSDRALAFLDYAFDPELQVVWAARGGYGAVRLLAILDEVTEKVGVPEPKTLVGFSDATLLLDYVRRNWGWRSIHGPMPATHHIENVRGDAWKKFVATIAGESRDFSFRLKPLHRPKNFKTVRAEVVGGNLAMIASVVGTPYAFDLKGKILFLEEIGEAAYRIDRTIRHLVLAGALSGVRAIVLGSFTDCRDAAPAVYSEMPKKTKGSKTSTKPLRRKLTDRQMMESIFGALGRELEIPVYFGLPVGHGNASGCLELGRGSELKASGEFGSHD